jgi:short-subunit dehydrogenase
MNEASRRGALIVGASGGIGAALAKALARRGYALALVARRQDTLDQICQEINAEAGATAAWPVARAYVHDVRAYDDVPALFARIVADFGLDTTLDLVIYSAGTMPEGKGDAWTFAAERDILETNTVGALRWLGLAADAMTAAGHGTLAGISSVAGDRGRRGNSAYQASKAALSTYLASLSFRLAPRGVRVVTLKPGYVATPMTADLRLPKPLVISAADAAERIIHACERGRSVAYIPGYWAPIMWTIRHLPAWLLARLPL